MADFYNGCKLLSMKDLDGRRPEIFMCEGNRTAGKTFYFKRMLMRRYIKYGEKFCLLYRYVYELDGVADAFFKDIEEVSFRGHEMTSDWAIKNVCMNLYFDGKHCGYALAMNNVDVLKKKSSMFVDVGAIFMDEFQSEANKYVPGEIGKFQSIHTSIARGGGKHSRYVPVYMASNGVTTMNPYFVQFGITKRLKADTKFMRGKGWVLERTFNEEAANMLQTSAFAQAFLDDVHMQYATGDKYLLDTDNFIGFIRGPKTNIASIIYNKEELGIWKMDGSPIVLISHKCDPGCKIKLSASLKNHTEKTHFVKANNYIRALADMFNAGRVFFEDSICKNAFIDAIGYNRFISA